MAEYSVRTFLEGDEEAILRLFESYHGRFVGFVLRTLEYWRWCCLSRPGVDVDSVFVAVRGQDEGVVGYSVVGRSGNVWELCVDRCEDSELIAELLLKRVVEWLTVEGASQVNFQAPVDDDSVRAVCDKLGFAEIKAPDVFVSVFDFETLILSLAKGCQKELRSLDEVVEFRLIDAPNWIKDKFCLKFNDGHVEVLDGSQEVTVSVETDVVTLSRILLQKMGLFSAFIRGEVKIRPLRRFWCVSRLFSTLESKELWFTPLSDFG
jgi:hypothetical protein